MNWKGVKDTSLVANFYSDTLLFSKAFLMSDGENMSFYLMVDDTADSSFGSDSINFEVGYQVGSMRKIGSVWDTVWSNGIIQDTCSLDSVYNPNDLTLAAKSVTTIGTGAINLLGGMVDTTSVAGYIYQPFWISPPWGHFIRFYAQGLAGNRTGSFIKLIFGLDQRDHQEAR